MIMKAIQNKIISSSRQKIKASLAYKENVTNIKKTIRLKYHDLIKNENNVFKKILIIIKKKVEIRKEIDNLTSFDKLYNVT